MINDNTVDGGKSLQSKGCHRVLCLIDNFFGHDATLSWVVGEGSGIQI